MAIQRRASAACCVCGFSPWRSWRPAWFGAALVRRSCTSLSNRNLLRLANFYGHFCRGASSAATAPPSAGAGKRPAEVARLSDRVGETRSDRVNACGSDAIDHLFPVAKSLHHPVDLAFNELEVHLGIRPPGLVAGQGMQPAEGAIVGCEQIEMKVHPEERVLQRASGTEGDGHIDMIPALAEQVP